MAKGKTMPKAKIHLDVAGQPGGPPPEVQAKVDAEQLAIIAAQKAARAPFERAEELARQAKLVKAQEAADDRKSLENTVKALLKRVEELETKNG